MPNDQHVGRASLGDLRTLRKAGNAAHDAHAFF